MANLTNTGTTGYPGVLDTRTSLTDGPAGSIIEANHPNGLGAAVLAIENELGTDPAGTAVDVKTRLDVSQNSDGTIKSSVIQGASGGVVSYSSGVFTINAGIENVGASNVGFIVSRVSNALTIHLMTAALATPSASSPVIVAFRDSPVTSGGTDILTIQSSINTVISSGSSAGMIANQDGRIYLGILNVSSTPELCWWNSLETHISTPSYTLFGFSEAVLQSTTAEGGAGGADSAGVLFSTTARASVPFRYLGYMDIKMGASAGTWSADPTAIQVLGPGVARTGDPIQRIATQTGSVLTGTTQLPSDNTIPQQGEGDRWLSATITSSNLANLWRIRARANQSSAAISRQSMAVFRFGVADAMFATRGSEVSAFNFACDIEAYSTISSVAATGFQMRGGDSGATTTTLNGEGGVQLFNGVLQSYLVIEEVCT